MEVTTGSNSLFPAGNGSGDATLNKVAQIAHQAVDKVADAAGPTADWLTERRDSLTATHRKVVADTHQFVSAHPWRSIGFAFAAGFLISRLMR